MKIGIRISIIAATTILLSFLFWVIKGTNYKNILPSEEIRVASKPRGNYEIITKHICNELTQYAAASKNPKYKIVYHDIISEGSVQTINQIKVDSVDLGIVQANTEIPADYCGVIARLYSEYYMMFSHDSVLTSLADIHAFFVKKRRLVKICCLGEGSQSYKDLLAILDFYGVPETEYYISADNYQTSYGKLISGEADMAFFVTGLNNNFIQNFAKYSSIRFVQIMDLTGIQNRLGKVIIDTIAKGEIAHDFPHENYYTISTPAVLVATTANKNAVIQNITGMLFKHKEEISSGVPFLKIDTISGALDLPIHPGTQAFFDHKSEFWVKYSATIAFFGTVITAIGCVITIILQVSQALKSRASKRTTHRHRVISSA